MNKKLLNLSKKYKNQKLKLNSLKIYKQINKTLLNRKSKIESIKIN